MKKQTAIYALQDMEFGGEVAVLDILRGVSIHSIQVTDGKWKITKIASMAVGGWCVAFGALSIDRYVAAMYDGSVVMLEKDGQTLVPKAAGKIMESVAAIIPDEQGSVLMPTLEGAVYTIGFLSGKERMILSETQAAMHAGSDVPELGEPMIFADELLPLLHREDKGDIIDKVQTAMKEKDDVRVETREVLGCVGLFCT